MRKIPNILEWVFVGLFSILSYLIIYMVNMSMPE
ncbi:hypothetical protein SAMN06265364_11627 [Prevotella jejuni]|uniref:Uncharacterized protein n=1 Tax=Prevotella jejuni TaxID=1177574 RepID=A0AA94IUD4_9BACT|nr:hypothetical protein SAMN06265364_11627 [Prevotella jejuni]